MFGMILTPKQDKITAIETICGCWLNSDVGMFGRANLKEINKYNKQLNDLLDETCMNSHRDFEEAIYPIDIGDYTLKNLCEDELPIDLNELLIFKSSMQAIAGCLSRWHLYILGENCD